MEVSVASLFVAFTSFRLSLNYSRKHLAEDVCPYTCVLEACSTPWKLYISREEWMSHVKTDHAPSFQCLLCSVPGYATKMFDTADQFIEHTRAKHADTISEDQLSTVMSASRRSSAVDTSGCPLCHYSEPASLMDHVAEHVHSFSLRALPWAAVDPDITEELEDDDYFGRNDYFDEGSSLSSASSTSESNSLPSIRAPSTSSAAINESNTLDFSGHILQLALAMQRQPCFNGNGPSLLAKLSDMVASCVILDCKDRPGMFPSIQGTGHR
jgi:hypothetical protein